MTGATRTRMGLLAAAAVLMSAAWWQSRGSASMASAAPEGDPNVLWSIGKEDRSSSEFALAAADSLTYRMGDSIPSTGWRREQSCGTEAKAPAYSIVFPLAAVPSGNPVLVVNIYTLGIPPWRAMVTVNGRQGRFAIRPGAAESLDDSQGNSITYSYQSLRVPIEPSWLKQGDNEIVLAYAMPDPGSLERSFWLEPRTGTVYYDSIALLRDGGAGAEMEASVLPTVFYRRQGPQLREVTEIVVRHRKQIGEVTAVLKVGGATVKGSALGRSADFGERVIEVEVPALAAPAPYQLEVTTGGETLKSAGEFKPEKRWKIFAGLKIHNDIGYTDFQQNVHELDGRNIDHIPVLMRRHLSYKFNLEDTWLVENYLNSRSAAAGQRIIALARQGRIGINPLYLNLMTGMCTGEELYRSLYKGREYQKKFLLTMRSACLTDAPSHSWFTPSLLADAGVKSFSLGSNQTRAPLLNNSRLNEDSPFWWEGIDGRRVMAWYARSYLQFSRLVGETPTVERLQATVPLFLERYRRADYPTDAVLLYGLYTDNAEIKEGEAATIDAWNKAWEYPKLIPATDYEYFQYVEKNFGSKIPKYSGDGGAYWEDGAGSTAYETIMNRASQRMLPVAEMAASLAAAMEPHLAYPKNEFAEAWKNLLFYDEHTWGASRSVSQPDRDLTTEQWDYKRAYAWRAHWLAKDLMMRSMNRLVRSITREGQTLLVLNPDIWPRTDVVEIHTDPSRQIVDLASGQPLEKQVVLEKDNFQIVRIVAEQVPGLGYRAYGLRPNGKRQAPPAEKSGNRWEIESRYYRLRIDPETGAIASLYDLELGRELADTSAPYRINELLYVTGGEGSSIIRNEVIASPKLDVSKPWDARVVRNTGDRIVIRAKAKSFPEVETEISLPAAVKRVDIVNRLKKEEVREKEAVYFAFPFEVKPPEIAYEIQNTWVRPNLDQLPGGDREWFTTNNAVYARDAGATIAWATPDAPLITLCDINRGLWLKKLNVANGHMFSYAMNNYWFTNYKAGQGGDFQFRYHITSGRALTPEQLARFSVETRTPLQVYQYVDTGPVRLKAEKARLPLAQGQFFAVDSGHAQVTAFKRAEDGLGYVMRIRETAGKKGTALLKSLVLPLASATLANGVEDATTPLPLKPDAAVEIPLEPWRYTTVRLAFR